MAADNRGGAPARPEEVRCQAPHPTVRGWACRGLLFEAPTGSVELLEDRGELPPGYIRVRCPKCRAAHVVRLRAAGA
jgi:phage FluMu protein Com